MSPLWVFAQELDQPGLLTLTPDEARHVASRRLRVGDELVVFDGRGKWASARIESMARKAMQVDVDRVELAPRPNTGFGLATAIPKGERLSTMLQMWTQLGLETWQPLICADSVVRKLDPDSSRLQRILIEGCKVARRSWTPRLLEPLPFEDFLERRDATCPLYYGDREGGPADFEGGAGWVLVGPEAGFSDAELASLRAARAIPLRFGGYNLRIETAAVAALAVFNRSIGQCVGGAGEDLVEGTGKRGTRDACG